MQQNTWNLVRNRRGEEYSIFCVCVFLYFISLLGNKKNRMEMKLIKNEQSWENMLVERCNIQIGILLPEQLNMCTWVECVCGCENRLGEWAPSLLRGTRSRSSPESLLLKRVQCNVNRIGMWRVAWTWPERVRSHKIKKN